MARLFGIESLRGEHLIENESHVSIFIENQSHYSRCVDTEPLSTFPLVIYPLLGSLLVLGSPSAGIDRAFCRQYRGQEAHRMLAV